MKKNLCLLTLLVFALFITGCTVKRVEYTSYLDTVNSVLEESISYHNVSLEGYHYYLPKGATLQEKRDTNSLIRYNDMYFYLYVDVISYYHKTAMEYQESKDSYYSKKIEHDGQVGYLEITKFKNVYFVEFMYNYAKVEAYVHDVDIHESVYQMATILSSIKYNDTILESLIGKNALNYKEETYNILKPKSEQITDDYLDFDYDQVYEDYEGEIKDEDSIEILEDEER